MSDQIKSGLMLTVAVAVSLVFLFPYWWGVVQ